jgi:RNA polymerase sigma factor (sigma-70 family)
MGADMNQAVPRPAAASLGRDQALDALFRKHYLLLVRVAAAMLGTREAAEDAVQDAFVSLYRNWERLRDPEHVEGYLRAAVLNRCRSGIRVLFRERALTGQFPILLLTDASDGEHGTYEELAALGCAVRALPKRQREVVACRYLMELSITETAATLGISEGSVKRHAFRGLHALHTALGGTR